MRKSLVGPGPGHLLYPLTEFYELAGLNLPKVKQITDEDMPEPYRSLLVHDRDMTPTMEAAHGQKMKIRVLSYAQKGNIFSRQILLLPEGGSAPVLFAAIEIYLEHFPTQAKEMVLARKIPFGTILQSQNIEHYSHPDAYLQIETDETISRALSLTGRAQLFGRRNVFRTSGNKKLAHVLEILRPQSDELVVD